MADAALALMINVVPFVVRNDGYRWGQVRLLVSRLRLLLLVEAGRVVGVLSHNPSGRGFEPHPPHVDQRMCMYAGVMVSTLISCVAGISHHA